MTIAVTQGGSGDMRGDESRDSAISPGPVPRTDSPPDNRCGQLCHVLPGAVLQVRPSGLCRRPEDVCHPAFILVFRLSAALFPQSRTPFLEGLRGVLEEDQVEHPLLGLGPSMVPSRGSAAFQWIRFDIEHGTTLGSHVADPSISASCSAPSLTTICRARYSS